MLSDALIIEDDLMVSPKQARRRHRGGRSLAHVIKNSDLAYDLLMKDSNPLE